MLLIKTQFLLGKKEVKSKEYTLNLVHFDVKRENLERTMKNNVKHITNVNDKRFL